MRKRIMRDIDINLDACSNTTDQKIKSGSFRKEIFRCKSSFQHIILY